MSLSEARTAPAMRCLAACYAPSSVPIRVRMGYLAEFTKAL
jgi:hypothetical protein